MDLRRLACISLAIVVGAVTLESIQLIAVGYTDSPVDKDAPEPRRPEVPSEDKENDDENILRIYGKRIVKKSWGVQGPI
ncbi:MAG: hypothetical protein ACXACI_16730 [Candidatus Hodarchaeales archaeon]|jgi:hypothetical protein